MGFHIFVLEQNLIIFLKLICKSEYFFKIVFELAVTNSTAITFKLGNNYLFLKVNKYL